MIEAMNILVCFLLALSLLLAPRLWKGGLFLSSGVLLTLVIGAARYQAIGDAFMYAMPGLAGAFLLSMGAASWAAAFRSKVNRDIERGIFDARDARTARAVASMKIMSAEYKAFHRQRVREFLWLALGVMALTLGFAAWVRLK